MSGADTADIHSSLPEMVPGFTGALAPHAASWSNEDDYQAHADEVQYLSHQLQPSARSNTQSARRCCDCCKRDDARSDKFRRNVRRIVNFLNVSPRQKSLILDRYVTLVEQYADTKRRYTRAYHGMRFFTTLFGIVTPGLVSIQPFFGAESTENPMYWTVFCTSLAAALLNGFISLFKVDKKFQSSTRAYLNLESEGWSYFSLVGKYAIVDDDSDTTLPPTHANRFNMFMHTVEKIRKGESRVQYAHGAGELSASTRSRSAAELRGGGHASVRSVELRGGGRVVTRSSAAIAENSVV